MLEKVQEFCYLGSKSTKQKHEVTTKQAFKNKNNLLANNYCNIEIQNNLIKFQFGGHIYVVLNCGALGKLRLTNCKQWKSVYGKEIVRNK